MSNTDVSRNTAIDISFQGVNITQSIKPYIKSFSYTENEGVEADDFQLVLLDRDDSILLTWLPEMASVAQRTVTQENANTLFDRPPTLDKAQAFVTRLYVECLRRPPSIRERDSWVRPVMAGSSTIPQVARSIVLSSEAERRRRSNAEYVEMLYRAILGRASEKTGFLHWLNAANRGMPRPALLNGFLTSPEFLSHWKGYGFLLRGKIIQNNWNGNGASRVLDCGEFQFDEALYKTPPDEVCIKGTSLPYGTGIRGKEESRPFNKMHLRDIAAQMARECGMGIVFEMSVNPYYEELEQKDQSNIEFLLKLCKEHKISVKAVNNNIVLIDQKAYEAKPPVLTVRKKDGTYEKAVMRFTFDGERYIRNGEITMCGNPGLVSCLTVTLNNWGLYNGKYIIEKTTHKVDAGGYTTSIKLRQIW